jgi:hypothetical protein
MSAAKVPTAVSLRPSRRFNRAPGVSAGTSGSTLSFIKVTSSSDEQPELCHDAAQRIAEDVARLDTEIVEKRIGSPLLEHKLARLRGNLETDAHAGLRARGRPFRGAGAV